jgi:hypothetical protein
LEPIRLAPHLPLRTGKLKQGGSPTIGCPFCSYQSNIDENIPQMNGDKNCQKA